VLGESSAVLCPRCIAPLVPAAVGGQRIFYCERCRGMLVPMGAFATLVQDLRSHRDMSGATVLPFDATDLDRRTRCPKCGQQMDTHVYGAGGNVAISDCEHCEVNWLECGVLERIVRAPDRQYSLEA
jgi:Zn-finger nucleic acid-binding protein